MTKHLDLKNENETTRERECKECLIFYLLNRSAYAYLILALIHFWLSVKK